jgi:DNA gyrase/topoisomerase IV subunit B
MNYEKIIVELLGRIQVLEEQVAILMNEKNQTPNQELNKITTEDIRRYIKELKKSAKELGKDCIILKSGDIHKELKLKNAMPQVCNAMRQLMNEGDIVLHTTPTGYSSTIEIQYYV